MQKPKLVVIGVGDYYRLVGEGIELAFDVVAKVDRPDFAPDPGGLRDYVAQFEPDAAMILTPNRFHADHVAEMAELKIPTFVEKPLVTTAEAMQRIEQSVLVNPALYCSDFYVDVWGAQLFKWFGLKTANCLDPWIETNEVASANWRVGRQAIGDIVAMEATLLESVGPPASFRGREWLWDPVHGGVLWDMAYHHLALWFTLINEPLEVLSVSRYTIPDAPDNASETYASVELKSTSGIRVSLKVGKYIEGGDDRALRIIGTKGDVSMDFVEPSRLVLNGDTANPLARLVGRQWNYVAAAFREWVESNPTEPYGLDAARQCVELMLRIREFK